jgi:hypothetical protein
MLTLQFGSTVLGAVRVLTVTQETADDARHEDWKVEVDAEGATPAGLEASLTAIRALQHAVAALQISDCGTVVRLLAIADCRVGPTFQSLREHDPAPGDAHNRRRLTLQFHAVLQTASAVQSHTFTVRAIAAAGEPQRTITTGRAVMHSGEDPAAHEAAILPAVPSGFRRVRQVATRDTAGPSLDYEVQDEQVFTALPSGVDDGHYVISEQLTPDGRSLRTISGFFVGAGAKSRALDLRPAEGAGSRITENPFTRRVDFEFTELVEGAGGLAMTESLTFTTTRRVIDHPLLDLALPAYRQQVGAPQTEVVQEGSAIGNGRHASPPAPRFAADLIERRVQYSLPHSALPAERRWVTTWRYVSKGRVAIAAITPEAV